MLTFEWDEAKNSANFTKHGIAFEQACEVFLDPFSVTIPDPDHSVVEERFVTIGAVSTGPIVVASHTDRENVVRIISARRASRKERREYETS